MKSAVAVSGWVTVIIPALNEEEPIAGVVRAVAAQDIAHEIIVVDNGSNDDTARRARDAGIVSRRPLRKNGASSGGPSNAARRTSLPFGRCIRATIRAP